jgi:hypothetical protein
MLFMHLLYLRLWMSMLERSWGNERVTMYGHNNTVSFKTQQVSKAHDINIQKQIQVTVVNLNVLAARTQFLPLGIPLHFSQCISLRFLLMLSLSKVVIFPEVSPPRFCMHSLFPHPSYMLRPMQPLSFRYPNSIKWLYKSLSFSLYDILISVTW